VSAALAVGDLALSLPAIIRGPEGPHHPYEGVRMDIDPRYIKDVSAQTRLSANAQGMRGSLMSGRAGDLMLIGGSMAQCQLLSEADSLGAQIERSLHALGHTETRVASAAHAGHAMAVLLPEMHSLLAEPSRHPAHMLAILGGNHVEHFINHAPWVENPDGSLAVAFDLNGPFGPKRYDHTFAGWYGTENHGRFIVRPRQAYQDEPKIDALHPQLQGALRPVVEQYARDLEELHAICHRLDIGLTLATHPVNFNPDTNAEGENWAIFFMGRPGFGFLPSPRLFDAMVGVFNDATRRVARKNRLALLELDQFLDGDPSCFYDQWHLTRTGARRAGQWCAEGLQGVLAGTKGSRAIP
jgi:hypothetical protein